MESAYSGGGGKQRCYHSHPILEIGPGKVYGGACSSPVIKDADIYVALQKGDISGFQSDPWDEKVIHEIRYGIDDMHAPKNIKRFKKMITWLCNQLQEGKTIHVGCIGGHGRTGTVLSAIVAESLGKKKAIQYVRKHYCPKAVESTEQVKFLMEHYGVVEADPTKKYSSSSVSHIGSSHVSSGSSYKKYVDGTSPITVADKILKAGDVQNKTYKEASKTFAPLSTTNRSLWEKHR
jgi:hypothetical protein